MLEPESQFHFPVVDSFVVKNTRSVGAEVAGIAKMSSAIELSKG